MFIYLIIRFPEKRILLFLNEYGGIGWGNPKFHVKSVEFDTRASLTVCLCTRILCTHIAS